ncbi:MAG: NADH-quinone oxidoreductase subunit L [Thermogutta sp.]
MVSLSLVPQLLFLAWILPLASFVVVLLTGSFLERHGRVAGFVATTAMGMACVLSLVAAALWFGFNPLSHAAHGAASHVVTPLVGDWYTIAEFGTAKLSLGYYIDALTLAMFVMVTFVATLIHIYSFGYMQEELSEVEDPQVVLADGARLRRPGRFARFFQYLSLFGFSMLGLVVANNLLMIFVFWELVGICSYFLIGFYVERPTATYAGNKAFIVNRVGDFGMVLGLAAFLTSCGTLHLREYKLSSGQQCPGLISHVRSLTQLSGAMGAAEGTHHNGPAMDKVDFVVIKPPFSSMLTYGFLVLAGMGLFCGCVGKSAQFPLHVWLPDAMEGPTPVSALIHAATMVAAGVYLVGRTYVLLTPEVLLLVAVVGTITLFISATIALTATDIKKVLAYSTISQLGYMMLGLGAGGWTAGLFHLFTHAFFKALLFLGSGSVIHACGTNEMPQMGGLLRKMPWTAITMLIGCLTIAGAGIPLWIGLSGYHSKDAILAQVYLFQTHNRVFVWMYYIALFSAGLTAFYMFRLWFLTFAGEPRDLHIFSHAHESPKTMVIPLVVLALFAVVAGWTIPGTEWSLPSLLEQARVKPAVEVSKTAVVRTLVIPEEERSHDAKIHALVSIEAFAAALIGFGIAAMLYGVRWLQPADIASRFRQIHRFLLRKWYFDELYDRLFVRPVHTLAFLAAWVDRAVIDWTADHLALAVRSLAHADDWIDRIFVDGAVNRLAVIVYAVGDRLRQWQTGQIRSYIVWIVVGLVTLFILGAIYFELALRAVVGTS